MIDEDQQQRSQDDGSGARDDDEARSGGASREEGWAGRRGVSFDPTPHIQQLRGRGGNNDYLGVRWSLVWLRKEHPDAQIVTEHVQIDPTIAIFKATVSLPTGGRATGYGSETASDFGDYIEKAETKAIGRALRALGFGATNNEGADEVDVSIPATPPRQTAPSAPSRSRPTPIERAAPRERPAAEGLSPSPDPRPAPDAMPAARSRAATTTVAPPTGTTVPQRESEAAPPSQPRAAAPEPVPVPAPASAPAASRPARTADDTELADYSWSAFWPWARGIGLLDKKAIEDLIGRTTDGLLPAELRGLVLTAKGEG